MGVGRGVGGREDGQADVPLDKPWAQVAFKDSMIHRTSRYVCDDSVVIVLSLTDW